MPGTLFVVATPIGNLEDISARALRILREVSLIAAEDTRRTAHLLARYAISTPTTSLHEHNERDKSRSLVERLRVGENVALVSDAGTPTVADPGTYLIREVIAAGFRVEAVPGANAAIAALSVSGLANSPFTFMGFPPLKSTDRSVWFDGLMACGHTAVFYEAPHRVRSTLEQLLERAGDIEVVIGRELTKIHEEVIRGSLRTVLDGLTDPRGEFTIVADIGRSTQTRTRTPATPTDIASEFGELTNKNGMTRRQAMSAIARRHRISANAIYDALEKHKKSVE
jgi:16S rRNA (cytidine1402-2'-O)-methyltransferase